MTFKPGQIVRFSHKLGTGESGLVTYVKVISINGNNITGKYIKGNRKDMKLGDIFSDWALQCFVPANIISKYEI